MPRIEALKPNSNEVPSLYPQRAFEYVDQAVDRIKKLENGEEQKVELNDIEREKLLVFEKSLGNSFEKTYKISVNSTTLYLDYFATKEGRKSLWEKTGLELNSNDPAKIKDFILSNSELISKLGSATRIELSGEALAYKDQFLLDEIKKTIDSEGNISIQDIPVPQRIGILINPLKAKEKIEGLRDLKRSFKKNMEILNGARMIQPT